MFDRTVLMLFYRLLGKRVVMTAHNVNTRGRDGNDSLFNRLTLRFQYMLSDHIFVHTESMKQELVRDYGVSPAAVSVITYGINNAIPDTSLTPEEAKRRLCLGENLKVILFFGAIAPYKGLDLLAEAFLMLVQADRDYRLVIAGLPKGRCDGYFREVREALRGEIEAGTVLERIGYVSDEETEVYLKAADVLVLPYRAIFQSGILIMAASFGLPVVASDVGSFRADILALQSGLVCRPNDSGDLARAIEEYFRGDLYRHIPEHRSRIRQVARQNHSWGSVAATTKSAYLSLVQGMR
jgi:glycosyltransferase involved in cell wall biosynthesis